MIRKKILVLGPYPIVNPHHGGQKRTRALVDFYKGIFGEVRYVGIYHRGQHPDHGKEDILLGDPKVIAQIDKQPHTSEFIVGRSLDIDIHVRSHVAKLLMDYHPDIIQVEQAYLYAGLSVLLKELNMRPRLVFSSQNMEHKLKAEIFTELNIEEAISKPLVAQVKELEEVFSRQADLVIAVSAEDAAEHTRMGAKRCVVAPNGIEKVKASNSSLRHWDVFKSKQGAKQAVAFIGSGHPPNWMGFLQMVSDKPDFLPAGARILMGGGISEYFKKEYGYGAKKPNAMWEQVVPLGFLSEDHLAGLIQSSEVILLPITAGGGTNLKTAEAILSGKKIVATSYAFRGFERYRELPNIYVSDDPAEFKQLLVKALAAPYVERTKEQIHLAEQVQWKYCLRPIVPVMTSIARRSLKAGLARRAEASKRTARAQARKVATKLRRR